MDNLDLGETIKGFIPGQKVFTRYTLTRILGRGGMGVVWLARDDKLEREVALKFLPEIVVLDPKAIEELKREAKRNLDLTHPHIVRIHDFVDDVRSAAIAMEYVDGSSLSKQSLEQPGGCFQAAQLETWVRQLCAALDYAHHDARVVHRDLKPANLMIDGRDRLKVTDFGIARSIADSVSRVSAQAGSSGTPVYMSPQQMMGERPAVTDDIYALGATLYELLTGKPPFYSGNIIVQVQSKVPASLTERRVELGADGDPIPLDWEQTIAACLAKEPKDRPQSAGEVAERLGLTTKSTKQRTEDRKLERGPAVAGTRSEPARKSGSTSKTPLYAGLVAAALALGALGWYFGIHAPEQKRLAEQARIESERVTAEQQRIKLEQDKVASAEKEKQEKASAEAKAKAEEEQKAYSVIVAKIDACVDGSPVTQRAITDGAVKSYLAVAPERYRVDVEKRWTDRQTAWDAALEKEIQRLAAERRANARGILVVRSNPSGATIRIGDSPTQKSPITLKDQKLGRYPVLVEYEGYEPWSGEVEIRENETTTIEPSLVRSTGRVVINGPAGAVVREGLKQIGVLPLALDKLPTGTVRYLVTHPGHRPVELAGVVPRNGELRLEAKLERLRENSLGQFFTTVPGTKVEFCIWETRVRDFEAFVRATGHDATANFNGERQEWQSGTGVHWRNPGFSQTPDHPVVAVRLWDAVAFCRWLTGKERAEGRIARDQEYRLPTQQEWEAAAGTGKYVAGLNWPAADSAANLADGDISGQRGDLKTYKRNDGFVHTAPVGSFVPDVFGLHDMAGNVWEICRTVTISKQIASKGGSYLTDHDLRIERGARFEDAETMGYRKPDIGFRLVLAKVSDFYFQESYQPSITTPVSRDSRAANGEKLLVPDLNIELMPIPAGTFTMGGHGELPATQVKLTKPFWMGKTEVTRAQWQLLMPPVLTGGIQSPEIPVSDISSADALEFCRRLTAREKAAGRLPAGYAYSLPTEAEWEYACRAGEPVEPVKGRYAPNWEARLNQTDWHALNGDLCIKPVGLKKPNPWGLLDMLGNVHEFCLDWHAPYPGGHVTDPVVLDRRRAKVIKHSYYGDGTYRIARGGAANEIPAVIGAGERMYTRESKYFSYLGFRVVLAPIR